MVSLFIIWFTDSSKSLLPVPLILFQRTFWHLLSDLGFLPSLWFYPNYGSFLPAPSLSYAILIAEYFCQLIFPSHFLNSSRSLINEVTCCFSVAPIFTPCVWSSVAQSLMSDSATPWTVACQAPLWRDFPGKNIGVGCHFLLQGIFLTRVLNPHLLHLLHWQADSLPLSHHVSPSSPLRR